MLILPNKCIGFTIFLHRDLFSDNINYQKKYILMKEELKMKKLIFRACNIVASFALLVTTINVNTNCIAFIHQPKLPKGAKKLRKF